MSDPVQNFYHWLNTAAPGDICVYHKGFLMYDRKTWEDSGDKSRGFWVVAKKVDLMAKAVWVAYKLGDVFLVQRKLGDGYYEYIAIRTRQEIVT